MSMRSIAGFTEVCGPGQPSAHQQVGRKAQYGRHVQWGRQAFISMPYSWVSNIKQNKQKNMDSQETRKGPMRGAMGLSGQECAEQILYESEGGNVGHGEV